MKYALISDIHANLEALQACLAEIDAEGADEILCLGDIVGYGACPNECLDLVRQRARQIVIGNHDAAVIETTEADYFNGDARAAVEWTRTELTAENRDFLLQLPYTASPADDLLLVHASPGEPEAWDYVIDERDARRELAAQSTRLCFVGHTHVPGFFVQQDGEILQFFPPDYHLEEGERALVNVGSVGQPRDGDQRAAFGLYDSASGRIEIRRIGYDISRVQDRIRETTLPASAASRLAWGV